MAAAASGCFFFLTLRLAAVVVGADDQPGGFRVTCSERRCKTLSLLHPTRYGLRVNFTRKSGSIILAKNGSVLVAIDNSLDPTPLPKELCKRIDQLKPEDQDMVCHFLNMAVRQNKLKQIVASPMG